MKTSNREAISPLRTQRICRKEVRKEKGRTIVRQPQRAESTLNVLHKTTKKRGEKVERRKNEASIICAQTKQKGAQEGETVTVGENRIVTISPKLICQAQSKINYNILHKFHKINGGGTKELQF